VAEPRDYYRQQMIGNYDIPAANTFLFTSDAGRESQLPTMGNVINALNYISEKANEEDTFLMYFSGHGLMVKKEGYLHHEKVQPSISYCPNGQVEQF